MNRLALFLTAICFLGGLANGQTRFERETVVLSFPVKLTVDSAESGRSQKIETHIREEFRKIDDIELTKDGRYNLLVQVLGRESSGADLFVSAVSTIKSVCVLEINSKGRVVSRQPCSEFVTSRVYIGRPDEISEVAAEIVADFNRVVLKPLREIED